MDISIAKYYGNAKCAFSFVFDDGCYYDSTMESVKILEDVYKKTGVKIKFTSAQTVNFINDTLKSMWQDLIKKGWYDICAHSVDHCIDYNEITPYEKRIYDAKTSKDALEKMYGSDIIAFATPNGGATPEGCVALLEYFYAVRNSNDFVNDPDSIDWRNIGAFTTMLKYETDTYISYIDALMKNGGWTVQMDHWISEKEDDMFFVQKTHTLYDECMYLAKNSAKGNIWLCSFNEAVKYFKEREIAKIEIIEKTEKYITLKVTCDPLPENIFNYPLTLKINGKYYNVIPGKTTKILL